LSRKHFKITGSKHAGRRAQVTNRLERSSLAGFIHGAFGRKGVSRIERNEVEALGQDKDVRRKISASAGHAERLVMASRARIRIRPGDPIEAPHSRQWLRQI